MPTMLGPFFLCIEVNTLRSAKVGNAIASKRVHFWIDPSLPPSSHFSKLSCQVLLGCSVQTAAVCRCLVELGKSLAARLPESRHLVYLLKDRGDDFEGTSQALAQIWQVSKRLPQTVDAVNIYTAMEMGHGVILSCHISFGMLPGQENLQKGAISSKMLILHGHSWR